MCAYVCDSAECAGRNVPIYVCDCAECALFVEKAMIVLSVHKDCANVYNYAMVLSVQKE